MPRPTREDILGNALRDARTTLDRPQSRDKEAWLALANLVKAVTEYLTRAGESR